MNTIGQSSTDKYITSVYYIAGLWFDQKPTLNYRIHSFIILFVLLLPWVLCCCIGLFLTDTLSDATHALCTTLPIAVLFAKAMNLYVNNRNIQDCLRRVQDFQLYNNEEKQFTTNKLSAFFKLTIFYATICNLGVTVVCWRILLLKEPELPFAAWYPLDWKHNSRDYWIAHSIQFYGMLLGLQINLSCELLPCFFLTMIGCQLDILGMRLRKLNHERCSKNMKIEKSIDEHVNTHYYIMKLTKDVQQCYNFPLFVEISTVGATITANAFQMAFLVARSRLGDHDIPEYAHYLIHIACTVFRVFMPCYFGNLVLSASDALPFCTFSSGWLNMSVACRKKLVILMERMKRPTVIWAWILFPLTLEIFKSIMNFSYTMLTLLQNLD